MKLTAIVGIMVLLLAAAVVAQNPPGPVPAPANPPAPQVHRTGPPMPGMDMGQLMHGPMQMLGGWWKDPAVVNELRLTDTQVKQLDQISTNTKLALIDAAAAGLKGFVHLQSALEADQVNEAAYNQELDQVAAAAGKLVKDLGGMALGVRRTLTAEQLRKLEAMRYERRSMMGPHAMHPERPERPPAPPRK